MTNFLGVYFPEFFYVLCGLVCFLTAFRARKNESAKLGTMLFWTLTGIIFMLGKVLQIGRASCRERVSWYV